jgi:hypothetical protein
MSDRHYLVELYLPASRDVEEVVARARAAAEQLGREAPVRYVRSIFVPEDESCFLLYEAATAELALEASRRAGATGERVTEAIEDAETGGPREGGTR